MKRFERLALRLRQMSETRFGMGASAAEIKGAEETLKVIFGCDYTYFLKQFGWAEVGSFELFGLGKDVPPYLNVVDLTQSERTEMQPHLPTHLVPIMNDGLGNLFCLVSKGSQDDCPIVYWDHEEGADQEPEEVAPTFVDWLQLMLDGAQLPE